jgi:hypothetical protein
MYIDLVVLIVLMIVVIFVFKKFDSFVYFIGSLDILLRILAFIRDNLPVPELRALLVRYFPSSIPSILARYMNGIVYTFFVWVYVIIFMIFWFYITRTFFKKK